MSEILSSLKVWRNLLRLAATTVYVSFIVCTVRKNWK
jgi:hypothetical protein